MNNPTISPTLLLILYCALAFFAAFGGGKLPLLVRLTHTRLQLGTSFVAGLMLGLALLGLLPHAIRELGSVQVGATWFLGGFVLMFLVQRFLPFHHHDVVEGHPEPAQAHGPSLAEQSAKHLTWLGLTLGFSLHSIFDGLAMAASVAAGTEGHGEALGAGTALTVILHKPFAALAITTLMAASDTSPAWCRRVNLVFASVTPLGALLFFLGAGPWAHTHPVWLGYALAFCAGTFLCIAAADLLPELQFHSHDRLKLSLALLLGVLVAWTIARFAHACPAAHPAAGSAQAPHGQTIPERLAETAETPTDPSVSPSRFPFFVARVSRPATRTPSSQI